MEKGSMPRSNTRTTITSDQKLMFGGGAGPIDMKAVLGTNTMAPTPVKKVLSWHNLLEGTLNEADLVQPEPILFSKVLKKSKTETHDPPFIHPEVDFCEKFSGPYFKETPLVELSHKPGLIPINKFFHFESHRPRRDSDDDGLDDDDITATDGIIRKTKAKIDKDSSRRRSYIYEAIKVTKGEFIFPHRTYRPKVQVAYRVPPGHVPQAVVIERLHRLYKKTDINLVCQNLGIEMSDLIPPPHYGETNERFYQESMFRNRIKISGIDKREFIRTGGRIAQEEHAEEKASQALLNRTPPEFSSSSSDDETSTSYSYTETSEGDKESTHPFIKSKPPFGAQFPLEFFDNEEFDIRSGEDWIRLGYDSKDKKMYPIPGKAFLPMPAQQSRKFFPSLSEVTSINLLKKSDILDRFRKWLIKQRFKRQMVALGVETKEDTGATDAEMQLVARGTSTIPTLIQSESDSTPDAEKPPSSEDEEEDEDEDEDLQLEQGLEKGKETRLVKHGSDKLSGTSSGSLRGGSSGGSSGEAGVEGEEGEEDENKDDTDSDEDEFQKLFGSLLAAKEETEESGADGDKDKEDLVKRSESLLDEIFSDPDSLAMTPEAISMINNAMDLQEQLQEGGEPTEKDIIMLKGITSSMTTSGIIIPSSPDVDPFDDDGYERLVFEYNKMKKTHNYDWKWVEVAVFDYNPKTRMYFVRSILAPFVFAWVNKLYLVFDGEDPNKHGDRIKDAICRRIDYEYIMRYNLYIDCLPIDKSPEVEPRALEQILNRATAIKNLSIDDHKALHKIEKELTLEYKRTHMKLLFDHIVEKHPKLYKPWVIVPENQTKTLDWEQLQHGTTSTNWSEVHQRYLECATNNFSYKVTRIKKVSVVYKKEPFDALTEIFDNCLKAREYHLILTNLPQPLSIEEYQYQQQEQLKSVVEFLRKKWIDSILLSIRNNLGKIPKSWYNLEEHRWDVFEISKTSRFLVLVRFIAEDTLRHMVEDSLRSYVREMENLTKSCAGITKFYKWQNDLKTSDFPPPVDMNPPFLLQLALDKEGPKFTDLLQNFPKAVTYVFGTCIDASGGFRDIMQLVMKNLLFGTEKFLRTVDRNELEIVRLREQLIKYLKRGLVPVDIYAQKFSYYLPVHNLDLAEFIEEWEKTDHTTKEVKAIVEFHKRHRREIESELPTSIDICACRINVDGVKQALLRKKDELNHAILENFAKQLRRLCRQIKEDYEEIERKLTYRSDDIEEVVELKVYLETVPRIVSVKDDQIHKMIKDYELFERFRFPIPVEDFEAKWDLAMATVQVLKLADEASGWLDDDFERLLRVQVSDLSVLSDAVDSATLTIAGLVAYVEVSRAPDVCQEIRKIMKTVHELEEQNALLNKRQGLFNLQPVQNEALIRLTNDLEPFKNLWFTANDWLNVRDVFLKGKLNKADEDEVIRVVSEGGKTIRKCVKFFAGAEATQHIANEVRHEINTFKPFVPIFKTLKNPDLRKRHWDAISDIAGFTVSPKGNQSFQELLDQGIGEHVATIAALGELASKEVAIEKALDVMERGIRQYKVTTEEDPELKVQYLVISEDVLELLDNYMVTTAELQENPLKKPFELILGMWEKKIALARENIEVLLKLQKAWLTLQPSFDLPDIELRMPTEYDLFLKMERIWRRLLRTSRSRAYVLTLGSDNGLKASLAQFGSLLEKVQRLLDARLRPQNSDSDEDIPDADAKK